MLNFKKNTVVTSTLLAVALTLGTAQAAEYKASDKEGPIKIVNLDELESQVAKNMEKGAFGYIRGGAEDELNLNKNTQHFDKKYIMPRVMQGIEISDKHIEVIIHQMLKKMRIVRIY